MLFRLIVLLGLCWFAQGRSLNRTYNALPKLDGRIVGGVDTTIEEHPYQISLELLGEHRCGGSLIRSDVVLTAAHCTVTYSRFLFRVRAGTTIKETGGQVARVLRISEHPKYHPYDYDVSVLRLDRSFVLGVSVQTIELQPVDVEVPAGTLATVTGWGFDGNIAPTVLQEVDVPKVADDVCQDRYPETDITDRMTCYGYDEDVKGICSGDSGGPLVANGKQIGIVSFATSAGCAIPKVPAVYARVANKEIQDHINSCINE